MRKYLPPFVMAALSILCTGVALAASSPAVTSERSSSIGQTTATLGGTISPNGDKTTYAFQYGPTDALGATTTTRTLSSTSKSTSVSAGLSNLTPGTKYYYRLIAANSDGQATGSIHTFTTTGSPPPGATTGAAEDVGRFGATVTGVVDTDGAATTVTFQYGTSTDYPSETAAVTLPASSTPTPISEAISGLEPGTVFHYRLFAEHGTVDFGTGADMTFQTEPYSRPAPRVTAATGLVGSDQLVTLGRVEGPSTFSPALECAGSVTATYFIGRRDVGHATTGVTSSCSYSISGTVRNPSRRDRTKVSVKIRFSGNGYLAPANGRGTSVTLRPR